MNEIWIKTIFALSRNFNYLIRSKEKQIYSLMSYNYNFLYYSEMEKIMEKTEQRVREVNGLKCLKRDLREVMGAMPQRYRTVLELKFFKNQLFRRIAEVLNCSLRNAIYTYNQALEYVRSALFLRGYSDEILLEVFGDDTCVLSVYCETKKEQNYKDP